ncbi:MAG: MFS transporter [Eubacteriales bacterium]|nr:MFS transporter [Bacillota bacterium]MBV1726788.1 MFS transporter [Desulforudis sp.]MDZ4043000.1 MFS transporter [Eubacteriales bacterium]MBU4554454.1 MFS transporter [Bacillota bacterium]MBV1735813.1 MFS transporter [Desulforudis sp.]
MPVQPSAAEDLQRKTPSASRAKPWAALQHTNFRRYWLGQTVSVVGTWMQSVAMAWLVLELTNSPFLLGVVGAAQFAPILLFSLLGGVVADHVPKRKLIIACQTVMMLVAFALGTLSYLQIVEFWHIFGLALVVGLTNSLDIPARQAFLVELTGKKDLMNAIALHASVFNGARVVGPAIAGVLIAYISLPLCFFLNGISFLAVLLGLLTLRIEDRAFATHQSRRVFAEIGEGLRYIRRTPTVLYPMLLLALVSLFAFNFNVLVPVYARDVLKQGAEGFGFLLAAHGLGAMIGSLFLAYFSHLGPKRSLLIGGVIGVSLTQVFLAPISVFWLALPIMVLSGWSMLAFAGTVNTTVQLVVPDELRGRVMSVYSLVFMGMAPFGNLMAGAAAKWLGASAAFAVCGVLGLAALAVLLKPILKASAEPEQSQVPG